jgi:hypothetical protein
MTAKAAWLDEAGQARFRLASYEAVRRRLAIDQGRCLITTTPYNCAWLKTKVFDPWQQARGQHPDIDVIQFESTENPAFPREEYERALRDLPRWKFDMFHRGRFSRPAGLIYDSFDPLRHVVKRFNIPTTWPRWVGLDFGPTNTAAVFAAEEMDARYQPTGRLYFYREYHPGKRDPREHVAAILAGEPRMPLCVGGSTTEHEWREKFANAGLPVREPPIRDVEVGIDTVYATCKRDEVFVFEDLEELIDEFESYSRELDENGNPTEKIEAKSSYHLLDATRYMLTHMKRDAPAWDWTPPRAARSIIDRAPPGVFIVDRDRDTDVPNNAPIDWSQMDG